MPCVPPPRPLAVIRNMRLNSVALLVPLRSLQFSSVPPVQFSPLFFPSAPLQSHLTGPNEVRPHKANQGKGCQWHSSCPQHAHGHCYRWTMALSALKQPCKHLLPSPPSDNNDTLFGDDTLGQGTFGTWHMLLSTSMVDSVTCLRYAE
jgi:hypothetical protein